MALSRCNVHKVIKNIRFPIINVINIRNSGSLGCWSHIDPVNSRLKGVGIGTTNPNGQYSLKDVVYQDAGIYKCIGQSAGNKKKLEVLNTIAVGVKGNGISLGKLM